MTTEKKYMGVFTYPNGKEEKRRAYFESQLVGIFKRSTATHLAVYLNNKLLATYSLEATAKLKWTKQ